MKYQSTHPPALNTVIDLGGSLSRSPRKKRRSAGSTTNWTTPWSTCSSGRRGRWALRVTGRDGSHRNERSTGVADGGRWWQEGVFGPSGHQWTMWRKFFSPRSPCASDVGHAIETCDHRWGVSLTMPKNMAGQFAPILPRHIFKPQEA